MLTHSEQRLLDTTPPTTLPRRWIGTQHHSCHCPGCLSLRATSPLTWSRASLQQTAQEARSVSHKIQTHPDDIPLHCLPRHSSLRTPDIEPEHLYRFHCSWKSVLGSSPNLHIEWCSFSRIRQYFSLYKIAESIWAPASCCQGSNLEFILYMTWASYYVSLSVKGG